MMRQDEAVHGGGWPAYFDPMPGGGLGLPSSSPADSDCLIASKTAQLARTIETEIIPRLMLVHRSYPKCADSEDRDLVPPREQVAEFARLVLERELKVSSAYIGALRARGSSIEVLLLHLLAPTARLLGDLWKEDLCSFGEVTVGLSRLQQLLRELSSPFENEIEHVEHGRRAMLAAAPGEQHTFGITVVEEFLRRAGWDVWSEPSPARGELVGVVRGQWFDVVGLSLSCDLLFDDLGSTIDTLRRASLNRAVRVMVGGRLFIDHPELVLRIGADATAVDGRDAVQRSRHLVDMTSRLC